MVPGPVDLVEQRPRQVGVRDPAGGVSGRQSVAAGRMTAPLDPEMFDPLCPSDLSPIRFGDKWAAMIIRCLETGPHRSELRVPLHGVTAKVLTQSLRTLERDGLVSRTAYAGPPRRVEYELTALGRSLLGPMAVACEWAEDHWDELLDAREAASH